MVLNAVCTLGLLEALSDADDQNERLEMKHGMDGRNGWFEIVSMLWGTATLFKWRAQVVCDYCGQRTKAYYDNLVNCGTPDNNTLLNAVNAWNKRVDKN